MNVQQLLDQVYAYIDAGEFSTAEEFMAAYVEEIPTATRALPFGEAVRFNEKVALNGRPISGNVDAAPDLPSDLSQDLPLLNHVMQQVRNRIFSYKIERGYDGPVIVVEGDSWFEYPLPEPSDLIDPLVHSHAVFSLAAAGDTITNMQDTNSLEEAICRVKPDFFLFSGGGNDLLADGSFADYLLAWQPGLTAFDLINWEKLEKKLDDIFAALLSIYSAAQRALPGLPMLMHGYDYLYPQAHGKWLGTPLEQMNISLALGREILILVLDHFNHQLVTFGRDQEHFHYVDLRGVVDHGPQGWHDELHAKSEGTKCGYEALVSAMTCLATGC